MIWYDVDVALAAVPVNIAALIDDTDFKTREESVTFDQAGLGLVWNFLTTAGAYTQTAVTPTESAGVYDWTNVGNGMYAIEMPASGGGTINNDTEGWGWFTGFATGILPWTGPVCGFRAAGLNNALVDSAYSTTRGLAGTALPDAAADGAGGLPVSDAGGLDLDGRLDAAISSRAAATLFTGITAVAEWLGLLAGKQAGDATAITEIRATGAGSGTFDPTTDSTEAIRDTAPLGTAMRGTDSAALASVCTEGRLAELDAANLPADVDTLLARITSTLFSGITSLAEWLGLIAGKQTGDATARTELRATGAGSGAFDETTDSNEALRDHVGDGTNLTEAGGTGDQLTAVPWNAAWDAEVESEVTDGLNAYDPPTKAELDTAESNIRGVDSDTLKTLSDQIDTVDSNVDAILVDTGTTLQAELDGIQADTEDIQSRLPAALTGDGNIKSDALAINGSLAAAVRQALAAGVIIPGTVDDAVSPTTTEFEADDITEATADHYNGRSIIFTSGALLGQATSIEDYSLVGGKGHFTVVALTEPPADDVTFVIV
jgi:hypothetical protein